MADKEIAAAALAHNVPESAIRDVLNSSDGYTRRAKKGLKKIRIAALSGKREGGIKVRVNEAFITGKPMTEVKAEQIVGTVASADNAALAVVLVNTWHAAAIANDGWVRIADKGYGTSSPSDKLVVPVAPVAETPAVEPVVETPVGEPVAPAPVEEPVVPPVEEPKVEEKELVAVGAVEEKKRGRKLA